MVDALFTANARALGSRQLSEVVAHRHDGIRYGAWEPYAGAAASSNEGDSMIGTVPGVKPAGYTSIVGGPETRPANFAVHARIHA